jgi:hypothetical protein
MAKYHGVRVGRPKRQCGTYLPALLGKSAFDKTSWYIERRNPKLWLTDVQRVLCHTKPQGKAVYSAHCVKSRSKRKHVLRLPDREKRTSTGPQRDSSTRKTKWLSIGKFVALREIRKNQTLRNSFDTSRRQLSFFFLAVPLLLALLRRVCRPATIYRLLRLPLAFFCMGDIVGNNYLACFLACFLCF